MGGGAPRSTGATVQPSLVPSRATHVSPSCPRCVSIRHSIVALYARGALLEETIDVSLGHRLHQLADIRLNGRVLDLQALHLHHEIHEVPLTAIPCGGKRIFENLLYGGHELHHAQHAHRLRRAVLALLHDVEQPRLVCRLRKRRERCREQRTCRGRCERGRACGCGGGSGRLLLECARPLPQRLIARAEARRVQPAVEVGARRVGSSELGVAVGPLGELRLPPCLARGLVLLEPERQLLGRPFREGDGLRHRLALDAHNLHHEDEARGCWDLGRLALLPICQLVRDVHFPLVADDHELHGFRPALDHLVGRECRRLPTLVR
mmetsp:Transcript_19110/g.48941  ORF Transcript_19110/g.48941 Transcript_19110/m.48941 type:complete len:322 (+) Transcript_19110:307-1272(+)